MNNDKTGKRLKQTNKHKKLGFTNCLAIYILLFMFVGLLMGFFLALKSIEYNYVGALACFTIAFSPMATAASIVLGKVVDKNKAENTGGNGDGIKFAAAQATGFNEENTNTNLNSPPI